MQTGIRLPHGADFNIFTTRINGANTAGTDGDAPLLDELDFSDPVAVVNARTALLQMAVWEDFVKDSFQHGHEQEAREAIADTVLCLKAALWKEYRNSDPVDGLAKEDLHAAQTRFFSLLSPQGIKAVTAAYELAAEGIRYSPDTGHAVVNGLLRMVVSEEVISALRALGPAASQVAETLDEHAQVWRDVEPARNRAKQLAATSMQAERDGDRHRAATDMKESAFFWSFADHSDVSMAQALHLAARQLSSVCEHRRAAELLDMSGGLFTGAAEFERAAQVFETAALCSLAEGEDDRAAVNWQRAAGSWERADVYEDAAECWEAAGSPGLAAFARKRALQDAGAVTGTSGVS